MVNDRVGIAILDKFGEELGEASTVCCRALIQGPMGHVPGEPNGYNNLDWLQDEIADVLAGAKLSMEHFLLDRDYIFKRMEDKYLSLKGWHDQLA